MVVVDCCTGGEEVEVKFFTLGSWKCLRLWLKNQQCYGMTNVTGEFSASSWSKGFNQPCTLF